MSRAVVKSPLGFLCNKPPWGEMVAVDLKAGRILWRARVGTTEDSAPLGIAFHWGAPLVNGVAITAGGLAFSGAMDAYLRAFDARSGQELWQGRLPVPGIANPMRRGRLGTGTFARKLPLYCDRDGVGCRGGMWGLDGVSGRWGSGTRAGSGALG